MTINGTHLCPRRLVSGTDAGLCVAEGDGLPLASTGLAFTHCEIVRRPPHGPDVREIVTARELVKSSPGGSLGSLVARLTSGRAPLKMNGTVLTFDRPLVMAVLNVTPDSFSGDGLAGDVSRAVERGRCLIDQGADLIDVGGESTRPGAAPVDPSEECARVLPVISALSRLGIPVSVDTRRAIVMKQAVAAGASLINDVSALVGDPDSLATAAASGAAVVLSHMRGTPRNMQDSPSYDDVLLDVYDELSERIDAAVAAGIPRARLIIDPGLGFGKTSAHNFRLIEGLATLHGLGCPILVGASRKSFLGVVAGGAAPSDRLPGSVAAMLAAVRQGANMVRVHDVAASRQALAVWDAVDGVV